MKISHRWHLLGFLIFVLFSVQQTWAIFCSACGTENGNESKYCTKCGRTLIVKVTAVFCDACRTENPIENKHCTNCGRTLIVKETVASPIAIARWPSLPWKRNLFTKLHWKMSPHAVQTAINNTPMKRVDDFTTYTTGESIVRYMFADAMDHKIARMSANQVALLGAINSIQLKSQYARLSGNAYTPTHFTIKYGIVESGILSGELAVMDPSFRFINIGDGSERLAGICFSSLPDDGKRCRQYMSQMLKNRRSTEANGIIYDMWADSDTLIKARYYPDDNMYDVEILNWTAFDSIGLDMRADVNTYLESWHSQRAEPDAKCANCGGSGRPLKQEMLPCTNCGGDGVISIDNPKKGGFLEPLFINATCPQCNGNMKTMQTRNECPVCGGTGKAAQ